ncbi:MAG TPA: 2-phospho-L-lactate guanylyltransferase [Thermomicrobiales bacterium]|nr:2-phospho-L-lactate guanylyltransferase [Thermomicrobiales bacterium]
MQTIAVVPVKTLAGTKSRLAAALDPGERRALTLATLRDVLAALDRPGVAARLVVSVDPAALDAARTAGALALPERPGGGLNAALEQARDREEVGRADALLVVLGDLPLLAGADVSALLALADRPGTAVLAPDRHETGTNALLLRPPAALPFAFGAGSLARHRALAAARGLAVREYRAPGTALDLDTPDDLALLDALGGVRPGLAPAGSAAPAGEG